jgi:hypothetical protein
MAPILIARYTQASHTVWTSQTIARTWFENRLGFDQMMRKVSERDKIEARRAIIVISSSYFERQSGVLTLGTALD